MYYVEPDGLLFHVEELASAGVLPEEWAAYFMDQIGLSTYQSEDSLGFVNYISYGRRDENLGYYIIGVTVESQSQKVVGLWGTAEEWAGLQEPDAPAVLAAYKTYLGMETGPGRRVRNMQRTVCIPPRPGCCSPARAGFMLHIPIIHLKPGATSSVCISA